jgi:hypothetical protein
LSAATAAELEAVAPRAPATSANATLALCPTTQLAWLAGPRDLLAELTIRRPVRARDLHAVTEDHLWKATANHGRFDVNLTRKASLQSRNSGTISSPLHRDSCRAAEWIHG